jgi:hypothetical protein
MSDASDILDESPFPRLRGEGDQRSVMVDGAWPAPITTWKAVSIESKSEYLVERLKNRDPAAGLRIGDR